MSITRWSSQRPGGRMQTEKDGQWVLAADHLADRASLLATIRQAVEAMELAYEYAEVNTCETALLAALAACREKLEEKV